MNWSNRHCDTQTEIIQQNLRHQEAVLMDVMLNNLANVIIKIEVKSYCISADPSIKPDAFIASCYFSHRFKIATEKQ